RGEWRRLVLRSHTGRPSKCGDHNCQHPDAPYLHSSPEKNAAVLNDLKPSAQPCQDERSADRLDVGLLIPSITSSRGALEESARRRASSMQELESEITGQVLENMGGFMAG